MFYCIVICTKCIFIHFLHNILTTFTQIILLHIATACGYKLKCAENAGKPKNLQDVEDFFDQEQLE